MPNSQFSVILSANQTHPRPSRTQRKTTLTPMLERTAAAAPETPFYKPTSAPAAEYTIAIATTTCKIQLTE
ncbi:MAG TPA: hypothetical protein VGO47_06225 [Chlamydiales bacterium]|nr:hypothetical protein [Chlamydiales bacterium]